MTFFNLKLFFIVFVVFSFFSCANKNEKEVVRVVFYKMPSDVAKTVSEVLATQFLPNDDEKITVDFEEVNDANDLKERVENDGNISIVFSNTTHLPFENGKAKPFDISLYETFPSCVKRYSFEALEKNAEGATSLPVLLNTYHLFFNNLMIEKETDLNLYDVDTFLEILKKFSGKFKYPLLCAGGEDEALLFFVASVMQMVGDVYSIGDKKIESFKDRGEVFNAALELIVEWQKNGFLHPEWFRLKDRDISMFMDLKEIGVLFAKMSEYKKSETKQFYSLIPSMPLSKNSLLNGLPISVLSITEPIQKEENMSTIKSTYISKIIEYCISMEGQAELSLRTGFNPCSMSNISQSSTSSVRYLLATVSVVLQDVASILLEDTGDSAVLAKEIRDYFQVNGVGY